MRGRALSLGYSLNEHGMYKMDGKKKGEKVADVFKSEKDIFDFLGMEFKDPRDRVNGLSVVLTSAVAPPVVVSPPLAVEKKKQGSLKKGKKLIIVEKPKLKIVTKEEMLQDKLDESIVELVDAFKKHGIVALNAMNEQQLITILKEADKAFHLNKTPIMTDNEYDIVKEYAEGKYGSNLYFEEVGAAVDHRLPIERKAEA